MDKERKKRLQTWKIIITETVMVIFILALVTILVFLAMGYKLNDDGKLDQSGLLRVESSPTGATVTVDNDELFFKTDMSHLLSEGKHHIKLTKDNYDSWENDISITSGRLYRLDYPRLFKKDQPTKTVAKFSDGAPEILSFAPDRSHLLYVGKNSHKWQFLNLKGDKLEVISDLDSSAFSEGVISDLKWNKDSNKIIFRLDDKYVLFDLRTPTDSLNLSEEFGLNFSMVKFANDSGTRLLTREDQNLREISINDRSISSILLSGISDFTNDDRDILFITKPNEDENQEIGLYRDGEKKSTTIKSLKSTDAKLSVSEYLGNKYISVAYGQNFIVFKDFKKMDTSAKKALSFSPTAVFPVNSGRLIIASDGRSIAAFDSEQETISEFKTAGKHLDWLDGFLVGDTDENGNLFAIDFDGANRRKLADSVSLVYDNIFSADNKWLIFVSADGTKLKQKEL